MNMLHFKCIDSHVHLWHYRKTRIMTRRQESRLDLKVILDRDRNGAPEPVQDEDVLNINLGKEPVMTCGPVRHDRVTGEESVPGELLLLRLGLKLDELPGEDHVGAAGVLRVVVHLCAITTLTNVYCM